MMRFTGRLRYIFGPASSSPLDHEMTPENKALLAASRPRRKQLITVTRADGSTYLVPKDPTDQSLALSPAGPPWLQPASAFSAIGSKLKDVLEHVCFLCGEGVLMMTSGEKFVDKFMHATEKLKKSLGPADQGDMDAPVVHRHDEFEEDSAGTALPL